MNISRIGRRPTGGMRLVALASIMTGSLIASGAWGQDCPGGGGPCDEPHPTPGCDNIGCCKAVCEANPACCSKEWDELCVQLASKLCVAGGADLCADGPVVELGDTPFSTEDAATDGPVHPECQYDGQTYHDIWFNYIADFTGSLIVTTCEELGGSADYDTDLVVYDGCDCDKLVLLGCNDDDAKHPCGGVPDHHSTVTAPVTQGNCYKIRLGGWNEGNMGTGVLHLAQADAPPENDSCASRVAIGLGVTPFSTVNATTDGTETPGDCGRFGDEQVYQDIWYNYTADFTGTLQITTCEQLGGSADYDTRLAAYETCGCPADNANFLGCNDDDLNNPCGDGGGGFHSTLEIPVTEGICYKIRVGGFSDVEMGTGMLRLQDALGNPNCPGEGDCFENNGTPGCDDAACCNSVCADDPSCCDVVWDQACADLAVVLCDPPAPTCNVVGDPTLTQSRSQQIVDATGIACQDGDTTSPNRWARSYDLSAIPGTAGQDYTVHCVEVGIDVNTGSSIVGTVTIYQDLDEGDPGLPDEDLHVLGFKDLFIPSDAELEILVVSFDPPIVVPADTVMVVELFVPQHTDGGVWPGSNMAGEDADTWIYADGNCGITQFTRLSDLGFVMHWVQNVIGTAGAGEACPWDLDDSGGVGILDLLALLTAWGPNPGHPADFDNSGDVGILDLLTLVVNWGPCP
ncbi:MAG: hypothetical protein O6768_10305 [Planctomycetota bacterium]|nr:hypothetical protein [Planctomycetota bacterium]